MKLTKDTARHPHIGQRSRIYTTCCLVGIHPFAKIWYVYVKKQNHVKNPINLTLRSIFKVDTSSYGDTLMCQIWLANVKPKEVMSRTRICWDRQTKWFLYCPLNFVHNKFTAFCLLTRNSIRCITVLLISQHLIDLLLAIALLTDGLIFIGSTSHVILTTQYPSKKILRLDEREWKEISLVKGIRQFKKNEGA